MPNFDLENLKRVSGEGLSRSLSVCGKPARARNPTQNFTPKPKAKARSDPNPNRDPNHTKTQFHPFNLPAGPSYVAHA